METRDTLVFPISPEYLADRWGIQEGMRELIQNALDEDPSPRVEHTGKALEIEDQGAGLPREGIVLGISRDNRADGGARKSGDQIGQFGEGLLIGMLVLARSGKRVRVETVGYAFEPFIAHDTNLGCDVLQLRFEPCARERGTLVTVNVTAAQAERARGLFRHFESGYEPAGDDGRVFLDDTPGRVFLGGVFIKRYRSLLFSYDLALNEQTKQLQNRDRTVIDGWQLERAISAALGALRDDTLLEAWVRRALDGDLDRRERFMRDVSPECRQALRAAAERVLDCDKVVWIEQGNQEAAMDLVDRGYRIIEQHGDLWEHRQLMDLLGIKEAKRKQKQIRARNEDGSHTEWAKVDDLSAAERDVYDWCVRRAETAWGRGSLGKRGLRIFERHIPEGAQGADVDDPRVREWQGMFQPVSDTVAIKRSLLTDRSEAMEVVLHEAAHRDAYQRSGKGRHGEYEDRTRGFEDAICRLGARLAVTPDLAAASRPTVGERIDALLAARRDERGFASNAQLARGSGASPSAVAKVMGGGGGAPKPVHLRKVCGALGVEWAPVYLLLEAEELPKRDRVSSGALNASTGKPSREAIGLMREAGYPAELCDRIETYVQGTDRSLPFRFRDIAEAHNKAVVHNHHVESGFAQVRRDVPAGPKYDWRSIVDPDEPYLDVYHDLLDHLQIRVGEGTVTT